LGIGKKKGAPTSVMDKKADSPFGMMNVISHAKDTSRWPTPNVWDDQTMNELGDKRSPVRMDVIFPSMAGVFQSAKKHCENAGMAGAASGEGEGSKRKIYVIGDKTPQERGRAVREKFM
jgi:hypothetical protein